MKNVYVHRRTLTALSLLSLFITTIAPAAPGVKDLRKLLDPDQSDSPSKFTAVGSDTKNGCALSNVQMESVTKGELKEKECLTSSDKDQREKLIDIIGDLDSNPKTYPPSCVSVMLEKCRQNHDVYSEKIRTASPDATTHTVFGFARYDGATFYACRTFVGSKARGETEPNVANLNYFGAKYGSGFIANYADGREARLSAVNAKCETNAPETSEYDRFLIKVAKSQSEAIRADSVQKAIKQKADSIKNEVRKNIGSPAQPAK